MCGRFYIKSYISDIIKSYGIINMKERLENSNWIDLNIQSADEAKQLSMF